MRIHHLSCGTMCPFGGALMDGFTRGFGPARLACHCLLLETNDGLTLVDTGFGERDVERPVPRLSPAFLSLLRPRLAKKETAVAQVEALGFKRTDVRNIVLTHLDFDHAGGVEDFPHARVHVLDDELQAAKKRHGLVALGRYRPRQWNDAVRWKTYQRGQGERWFGFECVRDLAGVGNDVMLVPLVGHTWGHCGVAVRSESGRWLLHAGDAYFYREEMRVENPRCTPGLMAYQRLMEVDRAARLANQENLRRLVAQHKEEVTVFSAHDMREFQELRELQKQNPPLVKRTGATTGRTLEPPHGASARQDSQMDW